jgi:flagellar biosynthesis/type III secretory pathway protein FliH
MFLAKFLNKAKKIVTVLSLVFGLLTLSINANAQNSSSQNKVQNKSNQSIRADDGDIYRIAKLQGYNDGLRRINKDARKKHKKPQKTSEYKNGTNGYKVYYGKQKDAKKIYVGSNKLYKQAYNEKKRIYQQAYREGFLEGYNRPENSKTVDANQKVLVQRKRNIFSRFGRFILRH